MSQSSSTQYYVRSNGKVVGPFLADQLHSLKSRGRIKDEHEISEDRRNWMPAAEHAVFNPRPHAPEGIQLLSDEAVATSGQSNGNPFGADWFYAIGDTQDGPVTMRFLQSLAAKGRLARKDMVWQSGMDEWVPAESFPEIFTAPESAATASSGSSGQLNLEPASGYTVIWDAIIESLRASTSAARLDRTWRLSLNVGNIGMLITAVFAVLAISIVGLKSDKAIVLLLAAVTGAQLAFTKYLAVHASVASMNVVRSTPNTISSLSALNVVAVTWIFLAMTSVGAFWIALSAAFEAVYDSLQEALMEFRFLLLWAVAWVLAVGIASVSALHPGCLNVSIAPKSTSGQDGISVVSCLLKVSARFSTLLFGITSILSVLLMTHALLSAIVGHNFLGYGHGGESYIDAMMLAILGGVAPAVAYLALTVGSILLDTCQSIITRSGGTN